MINIDLIGNPLFTNNIWDEIIIIEILKISSQDLKSQKKSPTKSFKIPRSAAQLHSILGAMSSILNLERQPWSNACQMCMLYVSTWIWLCLWKWDIIQYTKCSWKSHGKSPLNHYFSRWTPTYMHIIWRWCPSSLAKLVNIPPISLWLILYVSMVNWG